MQYARLTTSTRKALIAVESTGWGKSAQELFDQTDVSGYETFLLVSHNGFSNRYERMCRRGVSEIGTRSQIVRDVVRDGGRGTDNRGRLHVHYISHAGTELERTHSVRAPPKGFYTPTKDGLFYPETINPFETVDSKTEAIWRFEKAGLPVSYVSEFLRPEIYDGDLLVGCLFGTEYIGKFLILNNGHLSDLGKPGVGSLPAYRETGEKPKIIMEVKAIPQKLKI